MPEQEQPLLLLTEYVLPLLGGGRRLIRRLIGLRCPRTGWLCQRLLLRHLRQPRRPG
jgi:hypothetical protein